MKEWFKKVWTKLINFNKSITLKLKNLYLKISVKFQYRKEIKDAEPSNGTKTGK